MCILSHQHRLRALSLHGESFLSPLWGFKSLIPINQIWIEEQLSTLDVKGLKRNSPGFNVCNLWVQVLNISLHWMSKDVGQKIGDALGGTVDIVILDNGSKEGQYMRLKVRINISKPLPREKLIKLVEGKRTAETSHDRLHLEKKVDTISMHDQNELKGKRIIGLNGEDNDVLNIEDSNQAQPMEIINSESREKEIVGVRNNANEGISVGGKENATQLNTKEMQESILQAKIADKMELHNKIAVKQREREQVDTMTLIPMGREDTAQIIIEEMQENMYHATTFDNLMEGSNGITNLQDKKDQVCTTTLEYFLVASSHSL
ncbi:hypothetical protein RND71_026384 [Anisodus tanguticus]|uniref:DUF4283 domain-containing protein n=1 Tax=Anisodus tanguticus TaxID=243964 RepID=A0AAE1VB87_9SOLA|nr:hypothetical protein RND71_026384 [Anisodus tanguticus]